MTRLDEIIERAKDGLPESEVAILAREVLKTREQFALALRAMGDAEGRAALADRRALGMKPHVFAAMVNSVRDLALQYGQMEQFRCRVADLLGTYIHVEHGSKGVPKQDRVVVPELTDTDDAWQDAGLLGKDYAAGFRDGYDVARQRASSLRTIPADRELGGGDRFDIGFVEACGLLAARPFDRPTLAAGLIREGGMVAALERTSSDGAGIDILREEMRSDLDALRAQPAQEPTP